jgi:peptidoglycan/xylan/chitin deacetylase (PgdA/CDA1 family)
VQLARAAVRYSGLAAVLRRVGRGVPILCYHNVVGAGAEGLGDPSSNMGQEQFVRQMEWLRQRYRIAPLDELLADRGIATRRGIAALTFDDGYLGFFRHAVPVLEAFDLPATVFIVSGAPGSSSGFWWDDPEVVRQLTPDRRRHWLGDLGGDSMKIRAELPNGVSPGQRHEELLPASWHVIRQYGGHRLLSFGGHSVTHRAMAWLDRDSLMRELVECRAVLAREINGAPTTFAYPYGSWNIDVHNAARDAGYTAAFTLDNRVAKAHDSRWALPRLCIPTGLPLSAFVSWLVDLRRPESNSASLAPGRGP